MNARAGVAWIAFGISIVAAACSAPPPPVGELIAVPTQEPTGFQTGPQACPGALLEGTLVADDDAGFVVEHPDGFVSPVIWPHGYVARDAERRELLDEAATVVAREGDHFSAGGGWLGPTDAAGFTICGGFDIVPASTTDDLGLPFDLDCGVIPADECRQRALEVVATHDRSRFGAQPLSLVFNDSGGFVLAFSDGTAVGADQ